MFYTKNLISSDEGSSIYLFQGLAIVLVLNLEWFDARLIHESRPGVLDLQLNAYYHLNELWLPELDFVFDKSLEDHDSNKKGQDIHIMPNGNVKYLKK